MDLGRWCSTIEANDIDNGIHGSISPDSKVHCGSTVIDLNKDETAFIGSKIELDSNQASASIKPDIYALWRQHPYLRDYCCFLSSNYHITIL